MFLAGHPNHQLVFMRIWQIEPKYLLNALRDFYEESALNITRILDVAQDLKVVRAAYSFLQATYVGYRSWTISWKVAPSLSLSMSRPWHLAEST